MAWRYQMTILGIIVFIALVVAVLVAKHTPEHYGMQPFGAIPTVPGTAPAVEQDTFLTSMMGEFLIWTQVVSYWTQDVGFNFKKATNIIYALIGLVGIFSMPIMGKVADKVVQRVGLARGLMLPYNSLLFQEEATMAGRFARPTGGSRIAELIN